LSPEFFADKKVFFQKMVDDSKKDTIFARFFDKNIICGTINAKQPSYRNKFY
jgi:hypothetical protein